MGVVRLRKQAAKRGVRLLSDVAAELGIKSTTLRSAAYSADIKYGRLGTAMTIDEKEVPACLKLALERGWIR